MDDTTVDLGFIEAPENDWRLKRYYFPSKVGGKPAWLSLEGLPSVEDLKCEICSRQTCFLLQVYAPNNDYKHTFHRTVFVFCCKTPSCYKENKCFKIFRYNLPKENKYYSSDPPDYNSPETANSSSIHIKVCTVCGCFGSKTCSRCKSVDYCCKEHQMLHWRVHKKLCNQECENTNEEHTVDFLFPENELVIEPEELPDKSDDEETPMETKIGEDKTETLELNENDLEEFANKEEDEQFSFFQKIISRDPEQVVRYQRKGNPLWCSGSNKPLEEEIPVCCCGAKRTFEFQIMPQLLGHLNVDSSVQGPTIDWGIVAIYTCPDDCSASVYSKEFAWQQNISQSK